MSTRQIYIITGPTSGIGRLAALELAKHGTVVLVGRDRGKLEEVRRAIEQRGQHATLSQLLRTVDRRSTVLTSAELYKRQLSA